MKKTKTKPPKTPHKLQPFYLIERGLRDGVVLDAELPLGILHGGEELGQRQAVGGQLVLQHVVVLLPQHGRGEAPRDEALDRVHVRVVPAHPQDDGVAVAKPEQWLIDWLID